MARGDAGPGSCIACSVDDLIMKARTRDRRWCKVEVSKVVINRRNREWGDLFLYKTYVEPFIAGIADLQESSCLG